MRYGMTALLVVFFAFRLFAENVIKDNGKEDLPILNLGSLDTLKSQVYQGDNSDEQFTIGNDGSADLVYGMAVDYIVNKSAKTGGGPDAFGYYWKDSDEIDGPNYNWVDISTVGTALNIGDEDVTDPLNLGFNFDFYGNIYNTVNVCSNGYLIFDSDYDDYFHYQIPFPDVEPNNFIAAYWNDLDPSARGNVYCFSDSSNKRFIVQYEGISQYDSLSTNTFQVILYKNGSIMLQYKEMSGYLEDCSVGVEDITGTIGLEVVYNAPLIKNNYAVLIRPTVKWLTLTPESGIVQPSESDPINAAFDSADLFAGVYKAVITLTTNDPANASVTIPVEFNVLAIPAPALSTPVNSGLTTDLTPTFDWSDVPIANSYSLLVDNNSDFSSPEINQSPVPSTYTPSVNLSLGTYYWKVRANTAAASSDYSTVWSVQLGALPAVPTLSTPANASSTTDMTPTFDWGDVPTATSYTILADNNSNFSSPEINQSPTVSTYTPAANLASGTYYWKVLATNAFGSSAYTASWTVRLQVIPSVPANITCWPVPVGGNLYYNWDDSANATGYDIYSSPNPYGTFTFLTHVTVSEFYYTPTPSKMFFYILATNATKESPTTIEVSATDK